MTLRSRIEEYRKRVSEIKDAREHVKMLERSHNTITSMDFGIADGEIVSLETLVSTIKTIMENAGHDL
jgi:hypothetical protein